jgi:uncharacterized DUF497 family protein
MDALQFVWDEQKNVANEKKHGISFTEAQTVFYDENARMIHDPDHSTDEERFILLGLSIKLRVLIVVHCYREKDQIVRIISARRASKNERKQYEEFLK